jgi:hypothetical protein
MDHLASGTDTKVKSLIDLVATDHVGLFSGAGNSPSDLSALGPCVADDKTPSLTVLGPPVGDE